MEPRVKAMIFGGTVEGRRLAEERLLEGGEAVVCVTTEYARLLLPPAVRCYAYPMDEREMLEVMRLERPGVVYDATHPFAVRATRNIRACADKLRIPYERILRADSSASVWVNDVEWTRDAETAADSLKRTSGPVLLTTGSHTLRPFASAIPPSRLYARTLPTAEAVALCGEAGIPPSRIIAMQGPFTRALNAALYDALGIRVMVSKDSGEAGGVTDKVIPALERDIHVVMIARPKEDAACPPKP